MEGHLLHHESKGMHKLSESTLIPLGLVVMIIGGVAWLTTLAAETHSNTESVKDVVKKQDEYNRTLILISNQLYEIQGVLGVKHRAKE